MRWTKRPKRPDTWRPAFALFPVLIGDEYVWWEWYEALRVIGRTSVFYERRLPGADTPPSLKGERSAPGEPEYHH